MKWHIVFGSQFSGL